MSYGHEIMMAWIAAALVMGVFWWIQQRNQVAGIVDVVWAFGTAVVAIGLIAATSPDPTPRDLLLCGLIGIWGVRLALHLAARLRVEKEDGRYLAMKRALGPHRAQPAMFVFFQVQALWAVMFALPVAAASLAPRAGLDALDFAGTAVWLLAIGGEWVSDRQLARFRSDPLNKGRVCRDGLWRYSRHPNYFFEWHHWIAYVLIGYGSPYWWVTVVGLVVMGLFLNYVTGIPFTEQQALRSRPVEYRDYQRTTSRFFPLPPTKQEAQ